MDASGGRVLRRPAQISDIDDAEIAGYIHSKKEFEFRKFMWEMMFQGYENKKNNSTERRKSRKQPKNDTKKAAEKSGGAAEGKINGKGRRLSSKINYDVLRKLMEEEVDGDQDQRDSGLSVGGGGDRRRESNRRDGGYGGGEEESGGDYYDYDKYGGDGEEDGGCYGDFDEEDGGAYEEF